mgnify:CR=1 FL=1
MARRHGRAPLAALLLRRFARVRARATFVKGSGFVQLGAEFVLAVVAGGFLIPSEQYESYAQKLTEIGCATLSFSDESTLSRPRPLDDGADALLSQVSSLAQEKGLAASSPLVLLGHSRGCKTVVAAASRTKRRVAALVLIDPVDKTGPDPSSVLGALSSLQVPTVVLGSGKSEYDCAPTGSNYIVFADALRRAGAPRRLRLAPTRPLGPCCRPLAAFVRKPLWPALAH